jgi:hypothetical protein
LIEFLGDSNVFKVFVVSLDLDGVVSTFKVMSLFLQFSDDGKYLGVMDLIILLNRVQRF